MAFYPHRRQKPTAAEHLRTTVLVLILAVLFDGGMLWSARDLTPLDEADAIPVEATFQAAKIRYYNRRGRTREDGFTLEFTDHDPLRIRYGWQAIDIAEELPKTSRRTRPVVLSGLEPGMVCEMLVDPRNPEQVMSLTTGGKVLVPFEAALEGLAEQRGEYIALVAVISACAAGYSLWALIQYDKMKNKKRRRQNRPNRKKRRRKNRPNRKKRR